MATSVEDLVLAQAVEGGYFQKYGVDYTLSYIQGSTNGIAAIASHSVDMMIGAASAAVSAQTGGEDVVVVMAFLGKPPYRVMASADVATMDDLRGKTVAVAQIGDTTYFLFLAIAKYLGWGPDDLQFVGAGTENGEVALLQTGKAQGLLTIPPADLDAEAVGGHQVFDMADTNIPYVGASILMARDYVASNRPTVLNVAKACIDAVHRWKTDQAFTEAVIQKYLPSTDPQFGQIGWQEYANLFPQQPLTTRDGMQSVIQQVAVQTPAAANIDVDKTFDNSIVQELVDSGFIQQIYGS